MHRPFIPDTCNSCQVSCLNILSDGGGSTRDPSCMNAGGQAVEVRNYSVAEP